jgi:hypothetical protein
MASENGTRQPNATKLLCKGGSLAASPRLAQKIGLNEAIAIQQIHYYLAENAKPENDHNYFEGRWWVYKSYEDWAEIFPYWSKSTVKRVLQNLKTLKLVLLKDRQVASGNHVNYYSVDYDAVEKTLDGEVEINRIASVSKTEECSQNEQAGRVKMSKGGAQNEQAYYKVVNKTSVQEECDKDLQHSTDTEASFTPPPAEKKPQDGLPVIRTKPEDRNNPRDPLYSALGEVCNGNGTGGVSFMQTLKALNEAFLFASDLDDLAERLRERTGFQYPAPAQILSYLPQYLLERDKEEEDRLKRLERRKAQDQKDERERESNRRMSQFLKEHPEVMAARREHSAALKAAVLRGEPPPPFPSLAVN